MIKYLLPITILLNLSITFAIIPASDTSCLPDSSQLFADQRINQMIHGTIKWGSIGIAAGSIIGIPIALSSGGDYGFLWILAGGITGLIAGVPTGIIIGYKDGTKLNKNPCLKPHFKKFGYQVGTGSDLSGAGILSSSFFLNYRLDQTSSFLPNLYKIGISEKDWRVPKSGPSTFSATEFKIDVNLCYEFRSKYFLKVAGLGFGRASGTEYIHTFPKTFSSNVSTPFFHVFAGLQFNVFDYFYVGIYSDYYPYGFYNKLGRFSEYPYLSTLNINPVIGTYIF